jgi:DNA repair exonuclease SbcCD ATPase subunit
MKLRALELEQFKKFDRPVRISRFSDGLNVLCGPNEMGKSTIMVALHAVLFERHRAAGEHIKAFQPAGHKTAPRLALDFELDGQLYRIEKQFLRNEYARLRLPDGRRFEGAAAEEELQRLLGFAEPGNRGITPEQLGAWSVLWVHQGTSFGQPDVVERARRSLEGALTSEVGALLGTDDAAQVKKAVTQALGEIVGAYERPRGRYKEVIEQIAELNREHDRLQHAKRRLAGEVEQLEAARRRLGELCDQREDTRLLAQRDLARKRRDELGALQDQIRMAEAESELAAQELQRLRDERERRATIAVMIEDLQERLAAADADAAGAREALAQSEVEIETLQLRRNAVEEQLDDAKRERDRLNRLLSFRCAYEQLEHLRTQDRQVRDAIKRGRSLRLLAEAIQLDETMLEQLRSAARELERTEVALRAIATVVRFALNAAALDRVRLNGLPLRASACEQEVVQPLAIEVDGIGTITVAPQIEGHDELLAARHAAERRLKDLLVRTGVEQIATAETRLCDKQRLLGEAALCEHRARVVASAALTGIDEPEALRIEIERRLGSIERERAALQVEQPPGHRDLEQQLGAVETRIVHLEQEQRELSGRRDSARHGREQQLAAHGRAGEASRQAHADLNARTAELNLAEQERPSAALDQALAEAESAVQHRRRALAELRARAAGANPDLVASELSRVEQTIERRRSEMGDLRERIAALQGGIDKEEGAGLEEQIEDVVRRLHLRERERIAYEREIAALRLLRDNLDEAERAAKERYLQPLVDRLRPYLRGLFPDADLTVDEAFRITAIRRGAATEEAFDQLSDGTREQIGVLARLAFAEMLADQGLPAIVVLDDALAFSDNQRLEQMFNILHHAARRLQIIVFTCRERLFESLGATPLQLVDDQRAMAAAD